jgi:hypothetical protein
VTFVARFEGGDWGGREQTHTKFPGHRLYMPGIIRSRGMVGLGERGTLPTPRFPKDQYELIRTDGIADQRLLTYRYVRPDIEGMQAEIARLRERVYELENPPRRGLMRFER